MFNKLAITSLVMAALLRPAIAQEREWALDAAEEDVFLLFGVPSTNDVGVSFWCKIATGTVSVFAPLPENMSAPAKLSISIGKNSYELKTTPADEISAKTAEAKLTPQDVILQDLQNAERFALTLENHKAVYPLEGADFSSLMKVCAERK